MSAMCQKRQSPDSFNNLIGAAGQRQWHRNAECLGGFQVDIHLDFCCPLHWQVGGLVALKNSAGLDAGQLVRFRNVRSVAHQTSGRSEFVILVDGGHGVLNRQRGELINTTSEKRISGNHASAPSASTP
jgi:hypothetical protein